MSLSILAQGRLIAAPVTRTGKNGKPFATFLLAAAVEDGEVVTVSGIAFDLAAIDRLSALDKGESVAISGRASLKTWEGKDGEQRMGLSVVTDAVLTAYGLRKRRESGEE